MQLLCFLLFVMLISPERVQAYLDPGTGSYIIQLIAGGGLGLVFIAKHHWSQIKNFIFKRKSSNTLDEDEKNAIKKKNS